MYSLRELQAMFQTTPDRIRLEMIFATSHERRLALVEQAIDWIGQEHTKTRQHRLNRGEDALTTDIVTDLKAMGFQASHDTQYGGHCDIVVEAKDDFLWIAEAKVHGAYDELLQGFQQLDTRYATGLPGQDAGELIIYCRGARADQVMQRWAEHLKSNRTDVEIDPTIDPLVYRSSHTHEGTGSKFRVRHRVISLHFNPQDRQQF